jgi:hypothetical protein
VTWQTRSIYFVAFVTRWFIYRPSYANMPISGLTTYEDMLHAHAQVARAKVRVRVSRDGLSVRAKLCRLCCAPRPKFRCACGTAYYCDATCQRADWRRAEAPHKHGCIQHIRSSQDARLMASFLNSRARPKELCFKPLESMDPRPMCVNAASFLRFRHLMKSEWRCQSTNPKFFLPESVAKIIGRACLISDDDWPEWYRVHVQVDDIAATALVVMNTVDAFDGMAVALLHWHTKVFLLHYRHAALARGLSRLFGLKCIQGQKRGFKRLYAGMWERIHGCGCDAAATLLRYEP